MQGLGGSAPEAYSENVEDARPRGRLEESARRLGGLGANAADTGGDGVAVGIS
jgi:hypothetical protein